MPMLRKDKRPLLPLMPHPSQRPETNSWKIRTATKHAIDTAPIPNSAKSNLRRMASTLYAKLDKSSSNWLYDQFDLCDRFSCQFWPIKPSEYDSTLVEADMSPGDGLVTVDGYKMISTLENHTTCSSCVRNIFHQVWLVEIIMEIHCACHIGHMYIPLSPK